MAVLQTILAIMLIGAGTQLFKYGQGLPTGEEDRDRDTSFLYEFLYGPPGSERVRALLGGVVLVVMGIAMIASALFAA